MAQLTDAELKTSLDGLIAGLSADGYVLDVRSSGDGRVEITIDATAEACADCLVPKDVMRSIAATMMNGAGASVAEDDIVITYPEGSAAH